LAPSPDPSTVTWNGGAPPPATELVTGADRYLVIAPLGRGGSGEVHAAWDRVLERRVALKWLHPEPAGQRGEQLLSEAQALARLRHPNVVAVHDVGDVDGRVFLAMDFIAGPTLGHWLAAEPRSWRSIVRVFGEAGRGLAALHGVGLVHRDFKPSNVLVAPGDHAVLTDLGLARGTTAGARGARRPGEILGTPAYMAPEQRRGESADERSDQYSFAVALAEALASPRPGPPGRLARALRRALAEDPAARFSRLEGLLAELDRSLSPRRGIVSAIVVTLVGALGLGGGAVAVHRRANLCAGGAARVAAVLGPERGATLRAALIASGQVRAGAEAERAWARIESWGRDWAHAHRAACAATHFAGEQSADLLDRRMACLTRSLHETDAVLQALASTDAAELEALPRILGALPPLEICAQESALLARTPPPADPALAARINRLEKAQVRAHAELRVGRYEQAYSRLSELLPAVRATAYRPLVAETEAHLGEALARLGRFEDALEAWDRALVAGLAGGDDAALAGAAGSRAWVLGQLSRFTEAHRALDLADAALLRLGDNPRLAARFANYRGEILSRQGRHEEALVALTQAVEIGRRAGGRIEPWDHAVNLNNLAGALANAGRHREAIARFSEALAAKRTALGPGHPSLATTLANLGTLLRKTGDPAAGLPYLEEARAIHSALPAGHPDRLSTEINYGALVNQLGRRQEALAVLDAAVAGWRQLPPERPPLAFALLFRGHTLHALGRREPARRDFDEALGILARTLGPDHPSLAARRAEIAAWQAERSPV
jgi:eukaryotic-like serine/threonine-protein kinase